MWEQIQQKSMLKKRGEGRNKALLTSDNFIIADNVGCLCPSSGQFFLGQFPDTTPESVYQTVITEIKRRPGYEGVEFFSVKSAKIPFGDPAFSHTFSPRNRPVRQESVGTKDKM